jgi:hypothetical protein
MSSVVRLSAWRISSCATLMPSFFLTSRVARECLNVCQPTCLVIPALIAAGRSCRCNAPSSHSGDRPEV